MPGVVERGLTGLCRVLAGIGLSGLLLLAAMTLLDGLLRSLANHPIDAVRDLGGVVAAMAIAFCLPIALLERSNITIRFLGGLAGASAGAVAERFAALVVLAVVGSMARQFFVYATATAHNGDATWILNIPTAPFWYVIDAMFWIATAAQVFVTIRVLQGTPLPSPQHDLH